MAKFLKKARYTVNLHIIIALILYTKIRSIAIDHVKLYVQKTVILKKKRYQNLSFLKMTAESLMFPKKSSLCLRAFKNICAKSTLNCFFVA